MSGYVLYGGGPSRSLMTEMVFAERAIAYELREIDIFKDEHRAPEFLAINPFGWVPALVTPEGETICKTPAINLWLCERHELDLVPPQEMQRAVRSSAYFTGKRFSLVDLTFLYWMPDVEDWGELGEFPTATKSLEIARRRPALFERQSDWISSLRR